MFLVSMRKPLHAFYLQNLENCLFKMTAFVLTLPAYDKPTVEKTGFHVIAPVPPLRQPKGYVSKHKLTTLSIPRGVAEGFTKSVGTFNLKLFAGIEIAFPKTIKLFNKSFIY